MNTERNIRDCFPTALHVKAYVHIASGKYISSFSDTKSCMHQAIDILTQHDLFSMSFIAIGHTTKNASSYLYANVNLVYIIQAKNNQWIISTSNIWHVTSFMTVNNFSKK